VRTLAIESLSVRHLRNLESVDVAFCPGFNVLSGENGQGKTNLLEAIYAVSTSRSFRTHKAAELVAHGQSIGSARASVVESGLRREQSIGIQSGARRLTIDGKRPPTSAAYAVKTPAVVFHPAEVALSMGGGGDRRRLLDRLSLYLVPASFSDLERYSRALRERQRALELRGVAARDVPEWEELMVRHGVAITEARAEASLRLAAGAREAFARIAEPLAPLEIQYAPGSPLEAQAFRDALAASRMKDARRGSASVGPHKDDLELRLDDRPVRGYASQGQHRAVVLALKSAEVEVIALARGVRPLLLLDDVSSELDRFRTRALFAYLQQHEGQVFLSTTRPELIDLAGSPGVPRRDFTLRGGVVMVTSETSGGHESPDLSSTGVAEEGEPSAKSK
jgi:DNA replication and repair protein RecF